MVACVNLIILLYVILQRVERLNCNNNKRKTRTEMGKKNGPTLAKKKRTQEKDWKKMARKQPRPTIVEFIAVVIHILK